MSRYAIRSLDRAPRVIKPRRFRVHLDIRGVRWRFIQIEVAFTEGSIADRSERIPAPSTAFFGIESPGELATITMAYQVAQKLHACSDPHDPPAFKNGRVRDIADLIPIGNAFYPLGSDLSAIRLTTQDLFSARRRGENSRITATKLAAGD